MKQYEVIREIISDDEKMLTAEIRTCNGAGCIMNIPQGRTHEQEMNIWGNDFVCACFRTIYHDIDFGGLNLTIIID